MNNSLVLLVEGNLVASSRQVAEDFGKRHDSVTRKIEGLVEEMNSPQNCGQYFIPAEYTDLSGKANKEYLLTRDGFTLTVMGFTGAKALQWKLKYIEAFNKMEQALKKQQPVFAVPQTLLEALPLARKLAQEKEEAERLKTIAEAKSDADMRRARSKQFLENNYRIYVVS